ncbi:MAG: RNA-binding transcriptional accessory protein, partial [Bacteroidia bacterium]|nr:RNA-binding transcriptional accessory protein [Bacteroidia bacterium]
MSEVKLYFKIADDLKVSTQQVNATVKLLDEGATVPFISRYRKEATGSLDEVQILTIKTEIERLRQLESRKESILKSIDSQGKLTEDLKEKIMEAETLSKLEDLYLPYKPKRRTKATIAREKGLEPLAQFILEQKNQGAFEEAIKYVNKEKEVENPNDALQGARDIISEIISEDAVVRDSIREMYKKSAIIKSRV